MISSSAKTELFNMYLSFISNVKTQKKTIKLDNKNDIFIHLLKFSKNTFSKLLLESSLYLNQDIVNELLQKKYIQIASYEGLGKYAITLKGISYVLSENENISYEQQFLTYLSKLDVEYAIIDSTVFSWKEKLASITLLLMFCTSETSAIRLNNSINIENLENIFDQILNILKKYGFVDKKVKIKSIARGESRASAIMSRLYHLPRKTNQYYISTVSESGYYFNIEKESILDDNKLNFLLKRIFASFKHDIDYARFNEELLNISQRYYPRFIDRRVNPNVLIKTNNIFTNFFSFNIYKRKR